MNNGTHRNGNGNGTATAVRRNGNGLRPNGAAPEIVEHIPATTAPEALAPVVSEALAQPLEPALVSQRKGRGGRQFDYVEGRTAIDQANQVFGYGGWGYELVGDVTMRTIEQTDSRSGEVTCSVAYSMVARVRVPGAERSTQRPSRRVLQPAAEPEPEDDRDARNLRGQLLELSVQQGFSEQQVRAAVFNKTGKDLDELGAAELNPLIASAADKLQQRQSARSA